jgi:AmiR/NasT family two-component response regulator
VSGRDGARPRGSQPAGRKLRILVVESQGLLSARLKAQLEALGHRVVGQPKNAQDAISAALALAPDLILMDVRPPLVGGFELAHTILASKPAPIVLLTGYAAADFARRAAQAGVMAYLVTPVERRQLAAVIEVAMARFGEFEAIRQEVGSVAEAWQTRTVVEQAKRVLMRRLNLPEAAAFGRLQQQTRRAGSTLGHTAQAVLKAELLLFRGPNIAHRLHAAVSAIRRGLTTPPAGGDGDGAAAKSRKAPKSHPLHG